ncbi:hypothetical protein [Ferruginibacter albus]|uniref:hypothetical protein n=1 Tax=Ferruginibacter albus TaxID=2875540 RepID=UPI001CC5386E|nr:hypothetical protein [Ferruginibacter albus]UAY53150.1 hypothetical protein K9M53_05615 [Ferruginibacter albus]
MRKRKGELETLINYGWRDMKNSTVSDIVDEGKSILLTKAIQFAGKLFVSKTSD